MFTAGYRRSQARGKPRLGAELGSGALIPTHQGDVTDGP